MNYKTLISMNANNPFVLPVVVLVLLMAFNPIHVNAQCEVTASVNPDETVCGDCADLTAFGQGQGQQVFNETFNSGSPTGWNFTQQADFSNPCSAAGVNGTTHIWMGDNSPVPRSLVTVGYNFTTATAGVTVCFDMLFAEQGGNTPCEGPDEPDEGVYLQYSTDGGATWQTVNYFDPNGGNDATLVNWNNWCFQLPAGAITTNTQIRWFQDNDSGAEFDHWGIDNVEIYYNDPTYNITWLHDGYSYGVGSSGGVNPNQVCPQNNSSYIVEMTNGTFTCRDTIELAVVSPTIEVDAGNDTTICPGDCAQLDGTAKVVKRPAKTPTYSNNEFLPIANAFGQSTSININVTDLNMTQVLPGSITEVCIENLTFFGAGLTQIFPPVFGEQGIADLIIYLTCPDGTQITLVPANTTVNSSPLQGYTQTCFVPSGGGNIAGGSEPYTGSWAPSQPFNNLVGCTANGLWSMEIVSNSPLGFGVGTFFGWSITFDDPEISYPADLVWAPAASLNDPNIEDPIACPAATTTYVLTASDTAGCLTVTDSVTVTVQPNCCNLEFTASSTDPDCGLSNGSISINVISGTGPYTYDWPGGLTGATQNALAAGTYTITITDNGQANCVKDTTITIFPPNAAVIDSVVVVDEACGAGDGTITIYPPTGAGTYSIDGGQTFSPNNVFTGLPAGNYTAVYNSGGGCPDTVPVTVGTVPGTQIDSVVTTAENCGNADGSLTIYPAGAAQYSIDGGISWLPNNVWTNLSAGSYTVLLEDANGCYDTTTATIANQPGVVIDSVQVNEPPCGGTTGVINVFATGSGITYSRDGGVTFQASNGFAGVPLGTHTIVVLDLNGCSDTTTVQLNASGVEIDSLVVIPETCDGAGDASIQAYASSTGGAITYTWADGPTGSNRTGLTSGTYVVSVEDIDGCTDVDSVTIAVGPPCCNLEILASSTDANCGSNDGSITINAVQGAGPFGYLWPGGLTGTTQTGLATGSYTITVVDSGGINCQRDTTVIISNIGGPVIDSMVATAETCPGADDGQVIVYIQGGVGSNFLTWNVPTVGNPDTIGPVAPGNYSVTVTDGNGCQAIANATVGSLPNWQFTAIVDTPSCGNANGAIYGSVTGGVAPYAYTWTGPNGFSANTEDVTGLEPGTYNVTIAAANVPGCEIDTSFVLPDLGSPAVDSIPTVTEQCLGDNDGTATVFVTGGSLPYTYLWSDNSTNVSLTGAPGAYTVTVTDNNGCTVVGSVSLQAGPVCCQLNASANGFNASCGATDGSIVVSIDSSSGTPPFTYSLDFGPYGPSPSFSNLAAGTYTVAILDVNSCSDTVTVTINQAANNVSVSLAATDPNCAGGADGAVEATAGGGTAPYNYAWSNNTTGSLITGLGAGMYTVTAYDANGCSVSDSVSISDPVALSYSLGPDVEICEGQLATLDAGIYDAYNWSSDEQTQTIQVSVGTYSVTVTDDQGCEAADTVEVSLAPGFEIDAGADTTITFPDNLELTATLSSDESGTYLWTPEKWLTCTDCETTIVQPDSTAWYVVQFTNNDGCVASDSILVTVEYEPYVAVLPNAFTPNGDGRNDELLVLHSGVDRMVFALYDRWGEKVFESEDLTLGWDGTFKGKEAPIGVYVYTLFVEFNNNTSQQTKGSVLLLR